MKRQVYILLLLLQPLLVFEQHHSWDGHGLNPNSHFRTLNFFINIIYDDNPQLDPNPNDSISNWCSAYKEGINNEAIPENLLGFMDTSYVSGNLNGFITRMLGEASFDQLQVTGDFVVINIKESTLVRYNCFHALCKGAVMFINDNGGLSTLYGHNKIEDYDFLNSNKIYFLNIMVRNHNGIPNGTGHEGIGSGTQILIQNNYYSFTGKGITNGGMGTDVVGHEISHGLFGGNGFHASGGNHRGGWLSAGQMPFFNVQGGYGLMGGARKSLVCCNGYDRWRMHWKHPAAPDYITARNTLNSQYVTSDISNASGNVSFVLRDFITYGDAIRIKLPYKDSSACSNQYIWLENHQIGYNNKLDYLMYSQDSSCRPQGTAGIYAYYQIGRDVLEGTYEQVWSIHERDNLKIIPAEGYYNYEYHKCAPYLMECINYQTYNYYYSREEANPFNGSQDQEVLMAPLPTDNILRCGIERVMMKKMIGNVMHDSLSMWGDSFDAFCTHRKIGMATNPSTCNTKTYYNIITSHGDTDFVAQKHRNNQTTYLTGLSIEIIPVANRNIMVNIRWDDYDIVNDVNFTGRVVNSEQVNLTSNNTIYLLQNKTIAQPYRDTQTGLFAKATEFVCKSGSMFTQQPNSGLKVLEGSSFILQAGSHYQVKSGAEVTVGAGSAMIAELGSRIIFEGTLRVDSAAIVTIRDSVFCSPQTRIIVNPGGKLIIDGGVLTNILQEQIRY